MLQKEIDTNYWFEIFYLCAVIVILLFVKTTLLALHYSWREETGSDTFWTDLAIYLSKLLPLNFFRMTYLLILPCLLDVCLKLLVS